MKRLGRKTMLQHRYCLESYTLEIPISKPNSSYQVISTSSTQAVLDISSLSSGVYLLKAIELNGNALQKKLIVE